MCEKLYLKFTTLFTYDEGKNREETSTVYEIKQWCVRSFQSKCYKEFGILQSRGVRLSVCLSNLLEL